MPESYDVLAVNLITHRIRILAEKKTRKNAEAIVEMAVRRRGVETEFFVEVVTGHYHEGDMWKGEQL